MTIYANRRPDDLVRNAFYTQARRGDVLCLASPFFSYDALILEMADKGHDLRLIVRLGPATSPKALARCLRSDRVQIRFFTSRRFHTKLYVFGDHLALVGSANLTEAGAQSNHEVCISVTPETNDFDDLVSLFQSYWNSAEVLNRERLAVFERICATAGHSSRDADMERDVNAAFGDVVPTGSIRVGGPKPTNDKLFLESYRRTYQEFLAAFRILERAYQADGRRIQSDDRVPLRLEIDQFLSFIRERHARGDDYQGQPLRDSDSFAAFTRQHFDQWFAERWPYLDLIPERYATINRLLGTKDAIRRADAEDLFDALDVCHSFHDRFRFFSGGHKTMRKVFLTKNDVGQVRKALDYLLHGEGDFIDRMGTCIFAPEYKMEEVGRSGIQEVFGWVNRENIPVCNGRTVKSLRYLGADVKIIN